MRGIAIFVVSIVVADPHRSDADPVVAPDPFEACKVERQRQIAEAMEIADVNARGQRLAAIADCEGDDAVALPPPEPPPPPPGARWVLAAALGPGVHWPADPLWPRGIVAMAEVSAGLRLWRHISVEVFAGAA